MAFDEASICSDALIELGESGIQSLGDDSEHARTMKTLYPMCLVKVLAAGDWSFALKQVTLARVATSTLDDFEYVFKLPEDFLKLHELFGGVKNYRIVNDSRLHCNVSALSIEYIRRVGNPAEVSPEFAEALSKMIKWKSAKKVANASVSERQGYEQEYRKALQTAKTADAKLKGPRFLDEPSALLNARKGNFSAR